MGNSVIYRPAYDAEVEYLESTGTQWIDTGVNPDNTYTFDCKVATTHIVDGNYVFWGCRDFKNNTIIAQCFLFVSNMSSYDGEKIRLITTNDWTDNVNWNSGIVPTQNTMYELVGMTSVSTMNAVNSTIAIFGFTTNGANDSSISRCRIGYWKCYSNGVLVRDMIPVRIGSTGYMYDKVSKQLFANKGTGNFILGNDVSNAVIQQQRCVLYFGNQRSVGFERIYEEYEWLKGDGTAYIDTLINPSFGDELNATFTLSNKPTKINIDILSATDNVNSISFSTGGDFYKRGNPQLLIINKPTSTSGYIVWDWQSLGTTIKEYYMYMKINNAQMPNMTVKADGVICNYNGIVGDNRISEVPTTSYKIGKGYSIQTGLDTVKLKNITISSKINLVPCRLLRPIPAILDGNGIARQAGECGMWDKVSNKFYGNVANSGTFTVKGPKCYEKYDWLEVEVSSSEYINMMQLPVNSYEFSFIREWDRYNIVPHSTYFMSTLNNANYSYFTNANYSALIWDGRSTVYTSIKKYSYGGSVSINCDSQNYYIDGESVPIYGECSVIRIDSVVDNPSMVSNIAFSTSAITVDGSVRYVPCKLTHGIPASMDANGIARPAGTCGMWDKVNDKFYGNVASSGTFTVSNN